MKPAVLWGVVSCRDVAFSEAEGVIGSWRGGVSLCRESWSPLSALAINVRK